MVKVYKLADKIININSELEIDDSAESELFKSENKHESIDVIYKIKNKKLDTNNYKNMIHSVLDLDIYKNNKGTLWDFKYSYNKKHCYLVENRNGVRELFISNEMKVGFPTTTQIFANLNIQKALLEKLVLILHSSFIIHKSKSILFTAPSGIGKSTQADLWEKYKGAEIINGDKSAIGTRDNEYFAYGLPFSGTSNICKNREAPIKAIVALEQSKDNNVRKLSKIEAFKILLSQVAINRWNKDDINLAMDLIEKLIEEVPVLLLSCRADEDATDVLNQYIEALDSEVNL